MWKMQVMPLPAVLNGTPFSKPVHHKGAHMRLRHVVLHTPKKKAACGACRQVIAEFSTPETEIHWMRNGTLASIGVETFAPLGLYFQR